MNHPSDARERRRHPRAMIECRTRVILRGQWYDCQVRDIGIGGAALTMNARPTAGTGMILFVPDVGLLPCTAARLRNDAVVVRFREDAVEATRLGLAIAALGKGEQIADREPLTADPATS